ncbi:MAG: DUF1592 domain-containing protein [Polyangiales bacterium]
MRRFSLDSRRVLRALFWLGLCLGGCDTVGTIGTAPADRPPPAEPELPPPPFQPAPAQLQRLTGEQFDNAVRDLYGADIVSALPLEPDVREGGFFAVGASIDSVSGAGVGQYEAQALSIGEQAMAEGPTRQTLVGCTPSAVRDDACARSFITRQGRLTYRRALTEDEIARFVTLAGEAATVRGDFYRGLSLVVAAQLQSPYFLYRHELGDEVAPEGAEQPGVRELRGAQLASRLSFFLWNTTPDAALLDAAESGALDTPEGLEAEARRLLDNPRARAAVRSFFSEMLELDKLDDLSKDRNAFLHYSPLVGPAAREETLRTIEDHVFDADADYRDLMTTRTTFIDRTLAAIYEVPAPAREGFARFEHPEGGPRRGILGQLSFLALRAHAVRSSPTLRGRFVRINLLCTNVPPPPANVAVDLSDTDPTLSVRDQLFEHRENPVCASCHALMDPIGLGFENFDGLGQHRDIEWLLTFGPDGDVVRDENGDRVLQRGQVIDATGDLDGVPFANPYELTEALRNHPDLPRCLTRSVYRYATGHVEVDTEAIELRALRTQFAAAGYRVKELLVQVALSPGFRRASGLRTITEEEN